MSPDGNGSRLKETDVQDFEAAKGTDKGADKAEEKRGGEKTLIRDISFCGVANGANACMVDVKDGKILRIRPMHYDWKYDREELVPWVMSARGKTFEPSMKTLIPPFSLGVQEDG